MTAKKSTKKEATKKSPKTQKNTKDEQPKGRKKSLRCPACKHATKDLEKDEGPKGATNYCKYCKLYWNLTVVEEK